MIGCFIFDGCQKVFIFISCIYWLLLLWINYQRESIMIISQFLLIFSMIKEKSIRFLSTLWTSKRRLKNTFWSSVVVYIYLCVYMCVCMCLYIYIYFYYKKDKVTKKFRKEIFLKLACYYHLNTILIVFSAINWTRICIKKWIKF